MRLLQPAQEPKMLCYWQPTRFGKTPNALRGDLYLEPGWQEVTDGGPNGHFIDSDSDLEKNRPCNGHISGRVWSKKVILGILEMSQQVYFTPPEVIFGRAHIPKITIPPLNPGTCLNPGF